MTNTAESNDIQLDYPYFLTKNEEVPFWDNPHVRGYKVIPNNYYPITTVHGVISLYQRMQLKEEDLMILKVIGDAICLNQHQLNRYLKRKIPVGNQISKRLKRFRELSLVDRWHVRELGDEEATITPPAPYTLGIGGYKLLKHYYNHDFFMDPSRWDEYGVRGVQRYVSANEVRCRLVEAGVLRKWKWHTVLNKNPHLTRPLAVAEVETLQGRMNFIIDRIQMSQDFIKFINSKLLLWKSLHEKNKKIDIDEFDDHPNLIVLYTSTYSIAEKLQDELLLDTYEFPIWICVEEDMNNDGLEKAFYRPSKDGLKRLNIDFLKREI